MSKGRQTLKDLPHSTLVAAGEQILRGDLHTDLPVGVNADTVRDSLCCTKRLQAEQPHGMRITKIKVFKVLF